MLCQCLCIFGTERFFLKGPVRELMHAPLLCFPHLPWQPSSEYKYVCIQESRWTQIQKPRDLNCKPQSCWVKLVFKNAMAPSWAMRCKTGIVWVCAYVILIIEHLDQWSCMDVDHPYEILQHLGPFNRSGRTLMMHHGGCAGELPDCKWRRKANSNMKSLGVRIANTSCQQLVTQPYWSQLGGSHNLVDMCWYCHSLMLRAVYNIY